MAAHAPASSASKSGPDPPAPEPRKRIQFTHQQKQEIRDFYSSHYQCSAKQLRAWFEEKYGLPLRPSTISTILRAADKTQVSHNAIRARLPKYPELEKRLQQWVESEIASHGNGTSGEGIYFTNETLKTAAQELWKGLEEYKHMEPPSFSEGWIEKFKRRTNMPRLRRVSSGSSSTPGKVKGEAAKSPETRAATATTLSPLQTPQQLSPNLIRLPSPSQIMYGSGGGSPSSSSPPAAVSKPYPLLPALNYTTSSQAALPSIRLPPQPPSFAPPPNSASSSPPPPLKAYTNEPAQVQVRTYSGSSASSDEPPTHFQRILNPVEQHKLPPALAQGQALGQALGQAPARDESPLIPHDVAKCHLQILKIYLEQQRNNGASGSSSGSSSNGNNNGNGGSGNGGEGDEEIKNQFKTFEQMIDSRCAN